MPHHSRTVSLEERGRHVLIFPQNWLILSQARACVFNGCSVRSLEAFHKPIISFQNQEIPKPSSGESLCKSLENLTLVAMSIL